MALPLVVLLLLLEGGGSFTSGSWFAAAGKVAASKVLLTSNGLTTAELRAHFTRLLRASGTRVSPEERNGAPHVAYIPDAALAEGGVMAQLCPQRTRELKELGAATVDCFELKGMHKEQLGSRLSVVSAIYVDYGNTFYLMHYMRASGFAELVPPLVEQGVLYVGSSASSICAGETVSIAFWKAWDNPGYGTEWDLKQSEHGYAGLRLVPDVSFFPHFSPRWSSLVKEGSAKLGHKVVILNDMQGYLVDGLHHQLLGQPTETKQDSEFR